MAADFILAPVLVLGLMAGWFAFQAWVRRHLPGVGKESDILEGRWGCRGCFLSGACDRETECEKG